jgi:NAD(P)-dependent dehydrogenase (short-subunit alcohol dehydrogenase family)
MSFTNQKFALDGKVAIVTGAGGRGNSIGRAYAHGLANAGASVVVADLNASGAETVAEELIANGRQALAASVDISDPSAVKRMVQAAEDRFGGIDILVNNAALMVELDFARAIDTSIAEWNRVFTVNVTGALNCSQAVVGSMRRRGGGKIINAVSAGAYPATSVYGISKLALVGLTTTLAAELGRDQISVNAIAPGNTMSDAGRSLSPAEGPFRKFLDMVVVMRPQGAPDDLVGPLILLASEAGSWITGQVLHVDGGWILRP